MAPVSEVQETLKMRGSSTPLFCNRLMWRTTADCRLRSQLRELGGTFYAASIWTRFGESEGNDWIIFSAADGSTLLPVPLLSL